MRSVLFGLILLAPCAAPASDPSSGAPDSSDVLAVQATLDTFAGAWLAGDRTALERVLDEDYTYFTGPGADAHSWDREAEVAFASSMAKGGSVQSLRYVSKEIARGTVAGEYTVTAQVESRVVLGSGDVSSIRTPVLLTLSRDPGGPFRVKRQVDLTGTAQSKALAD